jgi:Zn-finger nucleic acid-binding protein
MNSNEFGHGNSASSAAAPGLQCPNCRQPMQSEMFERHDQGTLQLDLCFRCAGIWFDHFESAQLAPVSVVRLFREVYAHRDDARRPIGSRLVCPRCPDSLALSHDLCKTGRFSYYRCPQGDGRFTPFFQFLREKQFIRNLTLAELQRVRTAIRQVRCSECGAPVDLENDTQCRYCHAPVSFLDPDAVEKAVRLWADAGHRPMPSASPETQSDTLTQLDLQPVDGARGRASRLGDAILLSGIDSERGSHRGLDLIDWGMHAIGRLLEGNH